MIEVNGIQYRKRPTVVTNTSRGYGGMAGMLAIAQMFGGIMGGSSYTRPRPRVDIVKEYALIQQKKSKLCRNDRDWVEYQFEKNFEPIN